MFSIIIQGSGYGFSSINIVNGERIGLVFKFKVWWKTNSKITFFITMVLLTIKAASLPLLDGYLYVCLPLFFGWSCLPLLEDLQLLLMLLDTFKEIGAMSFACLLSCCKVIENTLEMEGLITLQFQYYLICSALLLSCHWFGLPFLVDFNCNLVYWCWPVNKGYYLLCMICCLVLIRDFVGGIFLAISRNNSLGRSWKQ